MFSLQDHLRSFSTGYEADAPRRSEDIELNRQFATFVEIYMCARVLCVYVWVLTTVSFPR